MAERVRRSILLSPKMLTRGSRGIKGPVVGWAFLFYLNNFFSLIISSGEKRMRNSIHQTVQPTALTTMYLH